MSESTGGRATRARLAPGALAIATLLASVLLVVLQGAPRARAAVVAEDPSGASHGQAWIHVNSSWRAAWR